MYEHQETTSQRHVGRQAVKCNPATLLQQLHLQLNVIERASVSEPACCLKHKHSSGSLTCHHDASCCLTCHQR